MKNFNLGSRLERLFLRLRDRLIPLKLEAAISKAGIKPGQTVLDYGCGIGSYTLPAAKLVGEEGKVYALDKQPLAIAAVKEKAQRAGLYNIDTLLSGGEVRLPAESVDTALLYGVLPTIKGTSKRSYILKELHRVLKPDGHLSTNYCWRIKKHGVLEIIEATSLYSLAEQKGHVLNFEKKS